MLPPENPYDGSAPDTTKPLQNCRRYRPSTVLNMRFPESNLRNEVLPTEDRTPRQQSASTQDLDISELVNNNDSRSLTAEQLSRSEALSHSRHNPDFCARNRPKTVYFSDTLSYFHMLTLSAGKTEDQGLLDAIYARLQVAEKGLPPLPQLHAPLNGTSGENGTEEENGGKELVGMPQVRDGDYWAIQHPVQDRVGSDVGSVGDMGDVTKESLERQRGWWKAVEIHHAKMEAIADAAKIDETNGQGLKTEVASEFPSQETTLVEDKEQAQARGDADEVRVIITPATPGKAATTGYTSSTPSEGKQVVLPFRESRPLDYEIVSQMREEVTSVDDGNGWYGDELSEG